jgi:hypothetical protein
MTQVSEMTQVSTACVSGRVETTVRGCAARCGWWLDLVPNHVGALPLTLGRSPD